MAASSLESRNSFAVCIKGCHGDAEEVQALFLDCEGNDNDKKSILEQAFRDVLQELLLLPNAPKSSEFTDLVLLAIASAQLDITYYTVPFILLSDILDCVTLDVCEEVFGFLEAQVSTWTTPEFYSSGKILLLRMCNDLLRRLSYAQNTVFCGRIQLFLARLFPLSEKSALNLMSHFNLENVTTFNKSAGMKMEDGACPSAADSDAMEIDNDDGLEASAPIDYNLYQKLWPLQDFFRNPLQCYTSEQWKVLTTNVKDVLLAFDSYKLDDTGGHSKSSKKHRNGSVKRTTSTAEYKESHYFAKFLTSEKLMNLQLHDSHLRRHILIQLLVLFQYLVGDVKFKTASHVITDAQSLWIKDTTEKVYKLLEETPPDGADFAGYIKQVLAGEKSWIGWKNDGCPSYEKAPLTEGKMAPYPAKEHLGDTVATKKKIDMGSAELSRLWNLCPDNLEACKLKSRVFVPDMARFLEEPLEQADPDAMIEPEYKVVNNPNFTWQALRLLSQNSAHFFQNTTAQIRQLPEYLEHVIVQTGKELQTTASTQ